jgi:NinB protein
MNVILNNAQQGHAALIALWPQIKAHLMAGQQMVLEVKEKTRSTEQNARMWALLTDVSRQVDWYGQKLTPEEWKDVFSASLKKQKAVPGLDGGFVILGQRTSKMSIREMGELMELIEAFGAQKGVRFTAPEWMEAHA